MYTEKLIDFHKHPHITITQPKEQTLAPPKHTSFAPMWALCCSLGVATLQISITIDFYFYF